MDGCVVIHFVHLNVLLKMYILVTEKPSAADSL